MDRRSFVGGVITAAGISAGGLFVTGNLSISDIPGGGPPPTENKIGEQKFSNSIVSKINYYQSGAAEILISEGQSCFKRLAFHHALDSVDYDSTGQAAKVWQLPDYGGELTVDMRSLIQSKQYPDNRFRLSLIAGDGEVCFSATKKSYDVSIPDGFGEQS